MRYVLVMAMVLCMITAADMAVFPDTFLGTWIGTPDYSILGPFQNRTYHFGVSKAPNGDNLVQVNLLYDGDMGYQRFYVSSKLKDMWYCGSLSNFTQQVEQTGVNRFLLHSHTESSVTFCLDSKHHANVFQANCRSCECAMWVLAYDCDMGTLSSILTMGHSRYGGSTHFSAKSLTRVGDPPVVTDDMLDGEGAQFSCQFNPGGNDGKPADLPTVVSGCPVLTQRRLQQQQEDEVSERVAPTKAAIDTSTTRPHQHCYVLSKPLDFRLEWTLVDDVLDCTVSAPAIYGAINRTWVGIGFRPLSRQIYPPLNEYGTGRMLNFGMEGADIVAGSVGGGLRTLYAEEYVGPPVVDTESLTLFNSSVAYIDGSSGGGGVGGGAGGGRVVLRFSRPTTGGRLLHEYGVNASLLSGDGDILWAMGLDNTGGGGGGGGEGEE